MQKLNNGVFDYYREDKNQFIYFYDLVKEYKIGNWWWLGDFDSNNAYYSLFVCGYYEFKIPHILIVEKDVKSIITFNIINSIPKEIYHHWQFYLPFYHSNKKEFDKIKEENKWLANFSLPNYVDNIYNGEEPTGYWNWGDCGENI